MLRSDRQKRVKFRLEEMNNSVNGSTTEQVSKSRHSRYHLDPNLRKLPPPVVFWSPWEKDAHRRNRAMQVELNKDLRHIAWQCSLSSRKIRHDAKQFRERIRSFWPDPTVVIFGSGYPIRAASSKDKRNRGSRKSDRKNRFSTYLKFTGQIVKSAHSVSKQANPDSDSDAYSEVSSCSDDSDSSDSDSEISTIKSSSAKTASTSDSCPFRHQRRKSETDLFKMRSEYITSEEAEKKSPMLARMTGRFSPKSLRAANKETVISACPSLGKAAVVSQQPQNVGPRCSTAKTVFVGGQPVKDSARFSPTKTTKEDNEPSRDLHSSGNASFFTARRPSTGTFLFDRMKATYELKMELRRSAREKQLQPMIQKYDKAEDLAQEKEKRVVYQGKVREYLEKLNSYLGLN